MNDIFQIRHGGPEDTYRHVGDLGNIIAGDDGVAAIEMEDSQISLNGLNSIIGRGVVIHAGRDDMGKVSKLRTTNYMAYKAFTCTSSCILEKRKQIFLQ